MTNDLGEFRVAGLLAGEYTLMAAGQPQLPMSGSAAGPGPSTVWAPTYYPGTTDQAAAQLVGVQQGDTVAGLEFRMISAPAHRVSGVVVDGSGRPTADAIVTLRPAPEGRHVGLVPFMGSGGRSGSDGTFTIAGVIAGRYVISAIRVVRSNTGDASFTFVDGGVPRGIVGGAFGGVRQHEQQIQVEGDVKGVRVVVLSPQQQ
jgi:hypothetical protein